MVTNTRSDSYKFRRDDSVNNYYSSLVMCPHPLNRKIVAALLSSPPDNKINDKTDELAA